MKRSRRSLKILRELAVASSISKRFRFCITRLIGEPSSVYYLAGWFMSVLGAGVKIRIAPGVGPDYAAVAHVLMRGPKIESNDGLDRRGHT